MGGGNLQKTCGVCCKTMRADNLKRHIKLHEKKPLSINEAETHTSLTSSVKCTNIDLEMLEKNVESYVDEFNRKIELGRNLKIKINKCGFSMHALPENMKEALKIYEQYGKNMDMEEIDWRGWQKDLSLYLDKPCNREIIYS